jgi:hypothetical protein
MPKFNSVKKHPKKLYDVNSSLDSAYKALKSHVLQNNYEVLVNENPGKAVELSISRCGSIEVQANLPLDVPYEIQEREESAESSVIGPKLFIPRNPVVETSFRARKNTESISSIKSSIQNSASRASYIRRIEQEIDGLSFLNTFKGENDPFSPQVHIRSKRNLSFRSAKLKSGNLMSLLRSGNADSDNFFIDGHTLRASDLHTMTRPTTTSTRRSKATFSKGYRPSEQPDKEESIKIHISSRASNKPEEYNTYSDTPDKISSERLNIYLQSIPQREQNDSLSVRVRKQSMQEVNIPDSLTGHAKALFKARRSEHIKESNSDRGNYTVKGMRYSPIINDTGLGSFPNTIDMIGESFELKPVITPFNDLCVINDDFDYKNLSARNIECAESPTKFDASSKLSDPKLDTQSSQNVLETRYSRSKPIVGSSTVSLRSIKLDETLKSLDKVSITYRPRVKRSSLIHRDSQASSPVILKNSKPPVYVAKNTTLNTEAFDQKFQSRPRAVKLLGKLVKGRTKSSGERSKGRMIHSIRIDTSLM